MALGHSIHRRSVGVFPSRRAAEQALHELRDSGFPMDRVSVITKDADRHGDDIAGADVRDRVGNKADDGAKVGAVSGGALGGLTGLLVGLGTLAIPGIGPIMLAGATATTLATTLAGGAIGAAAGSLIGALVGLGIPEERARVYNERVSRGDYLVIVDGSDTEISRAEAILNRRGIEEYGVYDAPDRVAASNTYTDEAVVTNAAAAAVPAPVATTPVVGATPGVMGTASGIVDRNPNRHRRAIGTFAHRRDAEAALTELRDSGFNMDQVSVIGKHSDHHDRIAGVDMDSPTSNKVTGDKGNKADDGAKAGAATGAALGGLGGLLVGLGTLAIPGVGPVVLGGAAATALATTLSGGAIGAAAGGLTGALVGLGIPEERAKVYNDRLNRGDYLVMVDGTEDEIRRAETLLNRRGIQDWGIYDASDVNGNRVNETRSYDVGQRDVTPVGGDRVSGSTQVVNTSPDVTIVDRRHETR